MDSLSPGHFAHSRAVILNVYPYYPPLTSPASAAEKRDSPEKNTQLKAISQQAEMA